MMIQHLSEKDFNFNAGPEGNEFIRECYRDMLVDVDDNDEDFLYNFFYRVMSNMHTKGSCLSQVNSDQSKICENVLQFVKANWWYLFNRFFMNKIESAMNMAEADVIKDRG